MNVEDIEKTRRLAEQYDKLIIRALERYGYDLKTTLFLLDSGEMKIEKDESGSVTTFYGPGKCVKLENPYIEYVHRIPLFSITEETYEAFYPDDGTLRVYPYKVIVNLRVKDLTNNHFETLGANVMF